MNWVKASDENGHPLSLEGVLGGPYCEMSDLILCITGSAALDHLVEKRWYLLNVSAVRRYSVLLCLKKEVCCKVLLWTFWYIFGHHGLNCLCGFVFWYRFSGV